MAKEKLFTPEDFDKPKDKNFWHKYKGWIVGFSVLIAAIVLCCLFCGEKEEPSFEQGQTEQVIERKKPAPSNGDETIITVTTIETQDTDAVKEGTSSAETPKEDAKSVVTTTKPIPQQTYVSDNIEQEAMNVIRGDYGNVPERREKLGSKYQEIQNRVNQLKKEGVF